MKSKKSIIFIICLCLVVIATLVCINSKTRVNVPDNQILIEGKTTEYVDLSLVEKSQFSGLTSNKKGEDKEVSGEGVSLYDIIEKYAGGDYMKVTVISDDEYKASLSKEEVMAKNSAVLLIEDSSARLYVFDDENCGRNVSNVKRIIIE